LKRLRRDTVVARFALTGAESAAPPKRGWPHWPRAAVVAAVFAGVALVAASLKLMNRDSPAVESIAVMPFVNAGADPDLEYLADGIAESLINSLSQLPKLTVMSRSAVFRYKGKDVDPQAVGRDLKVQRPLSRNGRRCKWILTLAWRDSCSPSHSSRRGGTPRRSRPPNEGLRGQVSSGYARI
jgi:hypothetical protein